MANRIKPLRRTGSTGLPNVANMQEGEIAVNSYDQKIWMRVGGNLVEIANADSGGASVWGSITGTLANQTDLWDVIVRTSGNQTGLAGNKTWTGDHTHTGRISLGSTAVSSASDLSKHIALYGETYGFSITGGALNYISNGQHRFHSNVNVVGSMSANSEVLDSRGNMRDIPPTLRNSHYTLTVDDRGGHTYGNNSVGYNWTLPTGLPNGWTHTFTHDGTSGTKNIVRGSGVTLMRGANNGNISLSAGSSVTVTVLSSNRYRAV